MDVPNNHNSALEESLLNAILESSDDCIKVLDFEGNIRFMNAGGLRRLKIGDSAQVVGTSWFSFWENESLADARRIFMAAKTGRSGNFTGPTIALAGQAAIHWNVAANPMRNANGNVTNVLITSRDITDQIRATEARTQLADDRFNLFVESVKDYALFMLDPTGLITTWNEGARRSKGYKASEIIGSHFSRFYTESDKARNHPSEELIIATREGRFEEEGWRVRKDGSKFWASVVISRVNDRNGNLIGFAKITRDLTERRAIENSRIEEQKIRDREQLLEQIFAKSPSFMALISVPDFRFIKSNEQHARLIGRRDIIGKTIFEVEPELEHQGIFDLLKNVVNSGEPYVGRELAVTYNGPPPYTKFLDFAYMPLRRPDGEVYAIAAQGSDVTEKVLSRRAVENERENFRNLFKQTPEMVCILRGPEHVFEFVNEAHVKVLGFDATGKSVREAQPESLEVHGILDNVYRTGQTAFLHEIPVTVGGRLRHFNLTYSASRSESGEINGILVLGTEISEQIESSRKLELVVSERTKELRESEAFLDSVVENLPNMVFVKDAKDLKFVRFNRAGEELLGTPRRELLGKSDHDFFPKEQADHFIKKDREVLRSGTILDIPEESIETRQRGRRTLHTRKIPIIGTDGKPEFLLGISEDITEWKIAEAERFRVIREQAALEERDREMARTAFLAEASTLLARSLNFHQTLKDLASLTVPAVADWCTVTMVQEDGIPERLAAIHRDPEKTKYIDELANYSKISEIIQVINTGIPLFTPFVQDSDLEKVAKDEHHLKAMRELGCNSCIVAPITTHGKVLGAIAFVSSNPERIYSENDLAMATELGRRAGISIENASLYESVQRAVLARDEFMSIASHELKTPLTSLKLQAQIRDRDIKKGNFRRFTPENLPKLVAEDEKQLNRLIRLVEDMLDVSRINSGKIAFTTEEFDLCDLVRDTASRYSSQFEVAGVDLKVDTCEPTLGHWDRFRIEQVVINLLTNALKYGEGKPVEVKVRVDAGSAFLSVTDHGLGIAEKDQSRIFEQFERAVAGNNISGLGLGLFISRKIVEAHQGSIKVESTKDVGTTFTVELPLLPPLEANDYISKLPSETNPRVLQ